MQISNKGIDLIKKWEGLRLKAYKDAAGVCTIGYGHTKAVKLSDVITEQQALEYLYEDIHRVEKHINSFVQYDFNQNEFDSLCSFAFNVGSITGLTQNGKRSKYQIAQHMLAYIYAAGKPLTGLKKRRLDEFNLYNAPLEAEKIEAPYKIGESYIVIVNGLRVRKAPSTDAALGLKSHYNKNKIVKCYDVTKDVDGNTWIKICSQKNYYWICAIYQGKVYVK